MIRVISATLVIFSLSTAVAAATDLTPVKVALEKYQKAPAVQSEVKKIAVYSLLEETKESDGELVFSKGLLRLSVTDPDPSLIVMTKEVIWVETPSPSGEGKHVMKIVSKDLGKRSKAPLAMLFEKENVLQSFDVKSSSEKDGVLNFVLTPKKPEQFPDITTLELAVDKKSQALLSLAYSDEIENKVTYQFKKPNFSYKPKKRDFSYTPPKGSEVVVY